MFKKYLSALLALAMLACAMPTTVLSETTEEEPQAEGWVEIAEPAVLPLEEAAVPEADAPAETDASAPEAEAPVPQETPAPGRNCRTRRTDRRGARGRGLYL